jgi:hypothetical protein
MSKRTKKIVEVTTRTNDNYKEESTVSTATAGDYVHQGGGLAGNSFYDKEANKDKRSRPKNPVITEESKIVRTIKKLIKECLIEEAKSDYQIYHNSYSSAISEVHRFALAMGYILDEDETFSQIGMGPSKPKDGVTNKFSLSLYKPTKKGIELGVPNTPEDLVAENDTIFKNNKNYKNEQKPYISLQDDELYKLQRKGLNVQVYGRGDGKYELNQYIQ